ncbi:MAG: hypothetical protein ABUK01_05290 [Leptospirales bacterium]
MKNRVVSTLIVLSAVFLSSGCDFDHPLTKTHNMACPQELNGSWKFNQAGQGDMLLEYFDIAVSSDCKSAKATSYRLHSETGEKKKKVEADLIFTKLKSGTYISIMIHGNLNKNNRYQLFRYEITGPGKLNLYILESSSLSEPIKSGALKGDAGFDGYVTNKGPELIKFINEQGYKLFEGPFVYLKQNETGDTKSEDTLSPVPKRHAALIHTFWKSLAVQNYKTLKTIVGFPFVWDAPCRILKNGKGFKSRSENDKMPSLKSIKVKSVEDAPEFLKSQFKKFKAATGKCKDEDKTKDKGKRKNTKAINKKIYYVAELVFEGNEREIVYMYTQLTKFEGEWKVTGFFN